MKHTYNTHKKEIISAAFQQWMTRYPQYLHRHSQKLPKQKSKIKKKRNCKSMEEAKTDLKNNVCTQSESSPSLTLIKLN